MLTLVDVDGGQEQGQGVGCGEASRRAAGPAKVIPMTTRPSSSARRSLLVVGLSVSLWAGASWADELQIGYCDVGAMEKFCAPGELAKKLRERAAADARAQREREAQAEKARLEADPAYRAHREAEAKRAAAAAEEAKRREAAALQAEMKSLGLPPHRADEARRFMEMREAAARTRGIMPAPAPGTVSRPEAPRQLATGAPPEGVSPPPLAKPPPPVCKRVTGSGEVRAFSQNGQEPALATLTRDASARCIDGTRRLGATLSNTRCSSVVDRMPGLVVDKAGKPREDPSKFVTRWTCTASFRCNAPVERCEATTKGTSRQ
jgi:hypothetical protein